MRHVSRIFPKPWHLHRNEAYNADYSNFLLLPVLHRVLPRLSREIPVSGMQHSALEIRQAHNVWQRPTAEAAHSGEYEVDHIVNSRTLRGRVVYKVRWKGYSPEDDTEEPFENIADHAFRKLRDFHEKWPRKPRALEMANAT